MPAHGEERLSSSREQGCHQEPKRPASCPGNSPPPGLLCKPPPCGTLCLCRSELTNAPRLQRAGGWGRRKGGDSHREDRGSRERGRTDGRSTEHASPSSRRFPRTTVEGNQPARS